MRFVRTLFSFSLFVFVCLVTLSHASAAPLLLDATSLTVDYGHAEYYFVSGPGFSFTGAHRGENFPQETYFGAVDTGIVAYMAGAYNGSFVTEPQLQGFLTVNGVMRPALFEGFAQTPTGTAVFPNAASGFPVTLAVPLPIRGSFTACLQPPSVGPSAPCDPSQLNFAVVNVDLPGTYRIDLGLIEGEPYDIYESYTAMATPEPASARLLVLAVLLSGSSAIIRKIRLPKPRVQKRPKVALDQCS